MELRSKTKFKSHARWLTPVALSLVIFVPFVPLVGAILGIWRLPKGEARSGLITAIWLGLLGSYFQFFYTYQEFLRYGLYSKTSEATVQLRKIMAAQASFKAELGRFVTTSVVPDGPPQPVKRNWSTVCSPECSENSLDACRSFDCIGFSPSGLVYYGYACTATVTDGTPDVTCAAIGDLDGDGRTAMYVLGTSSRNPGGMIVAPIPKLGDLGSCADGEVRAGVVKECHGGRLHGVY